MGELEKDLAEENIAQRLLVCSSRAATEAVISGSGSRAACGQGNPEYAKDKALEGHIMLDKLLMQNNCKLPLMLQWRNEVHKIFPFCHMALGQRRG